MMDDKPQAAASNAMLGRIYIHTKTGKRVRVVSEPTAYSDVILKHLSSGKITHKTYRYFLYDYAPDRMPNARSQGLAPQGKANAK